MSTLLIGGTTTPRRNDGPRAMKIARIDGERRVETVRSPGHAGRPFRERRARRRIPSLVHLANDRRHAWVAAIVPTRQRSSLRQHS